MYLFQKQLFRHVKLRKQKRHWHCFKLYQNPKLKILPILLSTASSSINLADTLHFYKINTLTNIIHLHSKSSNKTYLINLIKIIQ